MARCISMLANGGHRVSPTIVKTIRNADGTEVSREEIDKFVNAKLGIQEEQYEDININQNYLNAILQGMKSVTSDRSGTAYSIFRNFNISVGGKTGSAEAPGNKVNAWFVGFAPFENPENSNSSYGRKRCTRKLYSRSCKGNNVRILWNEHTKCRRKYECDTICSNNELI